MCKKKPLRLANKNCLWFFRSLFHLRWKPTEYVNKWRYTTFAKNKSKPSRPVIKNETEIRCSNEVHHPPSYLRQRSPPTNKASSSVMSYLGRYQLLGDIWAGRGWGQLSLHSVLLLCCMQHLASAAVSNVWLRYSNKGADTVFPFHRANKEADKQQLQLCM